MSQQGIVGRVMQLARADVNGVIESAADPEKMMDQLVGDYSAHISAAEQAIAQTIANMRMIEADRKEDARAAQQWGNKARAASSKADELRAARRKNQASTFDELARVALERQMGCENDVVTLQHTIDAQTESIDKLERGLGRMKMKLADLRRNRSSLIARARSVHAQSEQRGGGRSIDIMDPGSEVRRFEEKVRREERRVRGHEELAASPLDAQFARLDEAGSTSELESRLRSLKAGRTDGSRTVSGKPARAAAGHHGRAGRRSAGARVASAGRAATLS